MADRKRYPVSEMRATPQNPIMGAAARGLRSLQELASQYEMSPRIPLLGGTSVDELLSLPGAAREVENWSYGNYPMRINPYAGRTASFVPETKPGRAADLSSLLDVAANVAPLGALATKGVKAGARTVGRAGERLAERTVPPILERGGLGADLLLGLAQGSRSNVVKQKGGNWLTGGVEDAFASLKDNPVLSGEIVNRVSGRDLFGEYRKAYQQDPTVGLYEWVKKNHPEVFEAATEPSARAVNKWLDQKLIKYVKNEMGTPEDPIRALAERGVLHVDPEHGLYATLRDAERHRAAADALVRTPGLESPGAQLGRSPAARSWENAADAVISPRSAGEQLSAEYPYNAETMPWLAKVPPETPVYHLFDVGHEGMSGQLGFTHLADELRNALNPESGLPRELLLTPQQLEKVTVPQAVERVAKINDWRAAQKAEADLARANNAATVLHKEYPEQGYKWVEIKPQNADEWELANSNLSPEEFGKAAAEFRKGRQAALEDALKYEGDVMGHCVGGYCPDVMEGRSRIFSLRDKEGQPHVTIEVRPGRKPSQSEAGLQARAEGLRGQAFAERVFELMEGKDVPEEIVQIKGKGNRAPKEDYLPFVQDFVKSQQWGDVGDLQNTGLVKGGRHALLGPGEEVNLPGYYTKEEFPNMLREAFKETPAPEGSVEAYLKGMGYAGGGLVKSLARLAEKYLAKEGAEEAVKQAPKEQKMLQGFYRGYAGDYDADKAAEEAGMVFVTPQRAAGEFYANKRAAQKGEDPHLEMILADPFAGYAYGHSLPISPTNREVSVTKARQLQPEDVKGSTKLYAAGGAVNTTAANDYDEGAIQELADALMREAHG